MVGVVTAAVVDFFSNWLLSTVVASQQLYAVCMILFDFGDRRNNAFFRASLNPNQTGLANETYKRNI
jgi:hypothetical protein